MIGAYADYAGMSGGQNVRVNPGFSESRFELLVSAASSSSSSSSAATSRASSVTQKRRPASSSANSVAGSLVSFDTSSFSSSTSSFLRGMGGSQENGNGAANVLWKAPPSYKTRRLRASAFKDFVLVTEFSEIEGPVPLLTIPRETKLDDKRLNDLAVRLMSTDYQSRGGSHSSVAPDAQAFQTNLLPNIHALANYVTLCDVRARGFVRPLCISYVTGDDLKIPEIFSELRRKLLEASEMIKHTNRIWFEKELSGLLADFNHTKERFLRWQTNPEEVDEEEQLLLQRINLQSLASHISECELMLYSLEPAINDERARRRVKKWRDAVGRGRFRFSDAVLRLFSDCESSEREFRTAKSPKLIAPTPVKRTFESIRPFHVLCQWGLLPAMEILTEVSARYAAPTQCLKFQRVESFFTSERALPEEFRVRLDIGLLSCLTCVSKPLGTETSDGTAVWNNCESHSCDDEFRPECLGFLESWITATIKRSCGSRKPRTLTHDIFASTGFYETASPPAPTGHDDAAADAGPTPAGEDFSVLVEIQKYYVERSSSSSSSSSTSSFSSEPPPVSQMLSRDEVLDLHAPDLPAYMENLNAGDAGWCLGTFFHLYSGVAYHVLFSLLSGRPVIIAGPQASETNVVEIVRALEAFLPRGSRVLRWHTGIVSDFHVKTYQLVGLCVPERLCVQDMMCSATLNRVTVLNTENQHIFGPAYSGTILETLAHVRVKRAFASDKVVMSQIYAVLVNVARKVFLCFALTREGRLKLKEVLAALGLENCDRQIVKYLLDWSKRS